jgi:hypothetical protein
MEFAFAGLAWTRVRVFAQSHRYARLPGRWNDTTQQRTDAEGCLDSAFYGPARILGYLVDSGPTPVITTSIDFISTPDFVVLWALIKF